jgi:hypothetical protein
MPAGYSTAMRTDTAFGPGISQEASVLGGAVVVKMFAHSTWS